MLLSVLVTWRFANSWSMEKGRACCCSSLGLLFLNALNCCNRRMLSLLSASLVGFCRSNDQKVCTTFEMVPLTVPLTNVPNFLSENCPLLTAMAKAPSMRICSCLERLSMKMSWHPTERQYSSHRRQARDSLSCVPPVTAHLWVRAAEAKSAKSWSRWEGEIFRNALASVVGNGDKELRWVHCHHSASPKRERPRCCSVSPWTTHCILSYLRP